jgi:hypothetical protein
VCEKLGINHSALVGMIAEEAAKEKVPKGTPMTRDQEKYIQRSVQRAIKRAERIRESSNENRRKARWEQSQSNRHKFMLLPPPDKRVPSNRRSNAARQLHSVTEISRDSIPLLKDKCSVSATCHAIRSSLTPQNSSDAGATISVPKVLLLRESFRLGVDIHDLPRAVTVQWVFGEDFDEIILRLAPKKK